MSCHQWFADFVARYLAIINSSINFLIYCLVTACRNISYEAKLCHIFLKHIIVWKPFHTYHIMFTLVSLTNWQQEIPGGDELPGQPDAQHGLPKQHQQRHRHVHRNHILLPQVSPNLINSSVLSKYHPDMSEMFEWYPDDTEYLFPKTVRIHISTPTQPPHLASYDSVQ